MKKKKHKVMYDENGDVLINSSFVSRTESLKVAKLRQQLNLTRSDLARRVHIAENEITLIETGKVIRNAYKMSKIFNFLNNAIIKQKNDASAHLKENGWTIVSK